MRNNYPKRFLTFASKAPDYAHLLKVQKCMSAKGTLSTYFKPGLRLPHPQFSTGGALCFACQQVPSTTTIREQFAWPARSYKDPFACSRV